MNVLRELIESEKEYIGNLEDLLNKFIPAMTSHPHLPDELKGKEKIIFGNIRELLAFHKELFAKELVSCEESPDQIAALFLNTQKKFELYINYCANMPRSASLIHDYLETFFAAVSNSLDGRMRIEEYLMKPVERIMKYYVMLKDFTKYTSRACIDTTELTKALHVMQVVPKKADDVMNVGMLEGFTGNLNNQGKLLMQDTLSVANVKAQAPSVERKVFLFEKLLIFGEPLERKSNLLCYIYRNSVETHTLGLTANYDDDLTKFAVWSKRGSGTSEIFLMTARSPVVKKAWVDSIKKITEDQYFKARGTPKEVKKILTTYRPERSGSSRTKVQTTSHGQCNGASNMGKITPSNQIIDNGLQHVKLIPLDEAKSLDELTKSTTEESKLTVLENYTAQTCEELTVHKTDTVYLVQRIKKGDEFCLVREASSEKTGLLPASLLKKATDRKPSEEKGKLSRSSSFGDNVKKEGSKVSKLNLSGTLSRTASLKRKKDRNKRKSGEESPTKNPTTPKSVLDKLQQHWNPSVDSSEDDETRDDSCKLIDGMERVNIREFKNTSSEIGPEFKLLLRDVTCEAGENIKLTCTMTGNPAPHIVWSKNENEETELKDDGKYRLNHNQQLCTFEILNTEYTDTGTYSCTATNTLGTASCSAKVVVRGESRLCGVSKPRAMSSDVGVTLCWNAINPEHRTYSVEYREEGVGNEWEMLVPLCEHNTVTVNHGLNKSAKYLFRVRVNGTNERSEESDIVVLGGEESSNGLQEIRWRENIEEHYNICAELGRGRFSVVKRCVEKKSELEFAAKIVRRRILCKESVENEVLILQELDHPSVVSVHEIYDAPKGLVIVEQLLSGGRLFDHIVIMDMLTEEIAIGFIRQLLLALDYIHEKKIVHLDIKPENILLALDDQQPHVVLSDFGEAIRLGSLPYQHELTETAEFAAPEVISGDSVSFSTDMWSVGVIVYVLLSGISPFYSDNVERARTNVTEIRYKFPDDCFAEISDEAQDFIEELLISDPSHRPSAKECLDIAWIRMTEPDSPSPALKKRISLSRLAAFNARRRYQYESSCQGSAVASSQLLSPEKKSSLGAHRR